MLTIRNSKIYKAIYLAIGTSIVPIAVFGMLTTHTLFMGNPLIASQAFIGIALLNILQTPLLLLPQIVKLFAETKVALQRLSNLLMTEELKDTREVNLKPTEISLKMINTIIISSFSILFISIVKYSFIESFPFGP